MAQRPGFTLLELMVALLVGAMVLTVGRSIFDASVDMQRRVTARFADVERERVGHITIENAFATAHMTQATPFSGTAMAVSFASRCRDAYGGTVSCRVVASADPILALREERLASGTRTLAIVKANGRFEYVVDAGQSGAFVNDWSSPVLPLAVRWIPAAAGSDTLVFPILWAGH